MFFIQSILASITENIVPEYDVLITNVPTSVLENTQKRDDKYKLRGVGGEGSHITFKDKNPHDSWSAKMSFQPIKLKFKEQANIILWYTNDPIESGEFYNTNGQFVGIMAGLEFDPNSAQIILAINDGQDYSEYEELVLRETLPIKYFDAEMTLKLIYTKNNLKVEIYKGAELIHDALRFYDTSVLGDLGKGKHFSITTHYNNVEMDKGYMLNSFKAFERTENLTYRPRAKQDIKYEVNHEVENSISHMEHFMGYLTNLMGDQQGFTIASAIRRLNDDIKTEKIKIDALKDAIKAQKSVNIGEVGTKIQEMDMKMHGVIRTINDLKYFLIDLERDHDKNSKYTAFGICLCLALMITYLVLSDIISKPS